MLNLIIKIRLLLIILSISVYPLMSFAKNINHNNSGLNKSIETPNFKIIYNENSSDIAHQLSNNIELWGNEVYSFLGQKPKYKITVFLSNDTDVVNSFSAFTIVSLYLNNNSSAYNQFGNNWLESTFKHELAHNVTRIYDHGFWGGIVFSQMREIFIPNWLHEGNSVLTESKVSKEGRLYNPTFWSPERFLVNNNLNYYFYYRDADPYLDGTSFLNFYYNRYGKEKTKKSYSEYSSRSVFKILNSPITYFAKNVSKSNDDLLKEWEFSLKNQYRDKKLNYVEGKEIKLNNYQIINLLGESKNKELVFYAIKKNILTNNYENYIVKIDDKGNILNKKYFANHLNSVSYNKNDDSISYTKFNTNSFTGSLYNKGYSTNSGSLSRTKELDDSLRSYRVVKSKRDCFYYLKVNNEKTALFDCNNKELIPFSANQVMEHLRYDELSDRLYFVAGKLGETTKYIYTYSFVNHNLTKIVEGLNPYIKGNKLYFSYAKAPNGIFNIYEYNLNTKQIVQITDTKYGAFEPAVIGNNLYYMGYSTDKDGFIISSIFKFNLSSSANKIVNTYSVNKIDEPFNNGYVPNYSNYDAFVESGKNYKETGNNYSSLIFSPSLYTDFSSLSLDFLLGTGKHTLSFGLSESKPFISFSQDNFITLGILQSNPLYTIGFFGEKDGSQNIGELDFNPILFNGYGFLPSVTLNTNANTLGGGSLGGALIRGNGYISYAYKKPKTDDTNSFGYNEINASYSIFSFRALQVEGNGEILYGTNPFDSESEKNIWEKSNINNLYMASASIPFTLYVYKGNKIGYLGYNHLTISPKASYIYQNDALQNYTKGALFGVSFTNNVRVLPNINLGLDFTIYTSQKENIKGKTNDSGVFFSLKM